MLNLKNEKNLEDIIITDFEDKSFDDIFIFENNTKLPSDYSYVFPQNKTKEESEIDIEDGLYRTCLKKDKHGKEYIERILMTDSIIYIKSGIYSITNDNYNYEIVSASKITNKEKYKIRTAICSAATLGQKSLLIKFLNNSLNININDLNYIHFLDFFNKFLYENRKIINTKNAIQHIGWHNGEFAQYSDNVTFDYSDDHEGKLRELVTITQPTGSIEKWKKIINKFPSKDFNIIMGTSYASPLLNILGKRSYQINGIGDSENGKTFAGSCGLSIWGKPSSLMIGSNDTVNSIPKKAAMNQSIFMMIDDPYKKGNIQKGIHDNYVIGNEKGRGRLTKDSKLMKEDRWRLTCFISSETPLIGENANAGEYNRVLEYHLNKMYTIDKAEISKLYSDLDRNFALAGKIFIDGIKKYTKKEIETIFQKIERQLINKYKDEKLESHINCVSLSVLGLYLGNKIVMENDNFNFAIDCGCHILDKLMSKFEARQEIRAVEEMYSFYEVNQAKFSEDHKLNEKLGRIKDNSIVFIVQPLKKYLENLGYNFKNFKKYLLDNKLAEYKKVKINQQSSWRLVVPFQTQEEVKHIVNLYYSTKNFEIKTIEIDLNNPDELKKLEIGIKYFELKDNVPIPFDIGQLETKYNKNERAAIIENENDLPLPNEF